MSAQHKSVHVMGPIVTPLKKKKKRCDEVLLPIPVNVPSFGNEVFGDVISLEFSHWGGP